MNANLFFSALKARYRVFLLIVIATVMAAAAVSLVMPKTYIATVALLVDGRDEQSINGRNSLQDRDRTGYLQTQVDILTGMQVARKVVADLGLANNPALQEQFKADTDGSGHFDDWLAQALRKDLKVDTTQSSVIRLSYPAQHPQFAASVANAFANAYVATMLKLRTEPMRQASVWFDEQLVGLRANLERAQMRLAEYQREHGIVASDERFDVETARLAELTTQLARSGNRNGDSLAASLHQAETRLREMSIELGQRHPQYLQQQALVEEMRDNLMTRSHGGSATSYDRSQRAGLIGALAAQRERVLQLKIARGELGVLSHDAELAQQTYNQAMQRLMASRIESRASQTNVSILDQAVTPSKPAHPRVAINIGLSVVLGILLAMTVVYLMEVSDQRVRQISDLEGDHQVPVLAVLRRWEPAERGLPGPRFAHHLLR